jgi:hypothetical protein
MTGLLNDQSKDHNGLFISPHSWSYKPNPIDPSFPIVCSEEDVVYCTPGMNSKTD